MENKPVLGDVVTLHSVVGKYNKNAQLKDATLVKFTKGAAAEEITLAKASELGKAQENNLYTTDLYIVSGVITEVKDTQYGNVYITDGTNTFYVYGIYGETGTYFDKLSPVPLKGDTIKVVGIVGNYKGAEQMKNATLLAHTVSDANKVAADAAALKLSAAQLTEVGASIDLAAEGTNGSTIAWSLKAECANVSLADGKLMVVSLPTEDVEVVLVATLTLNDATATKELTVIVKAPVQEGHEPQIVATFEFGDNVDPGSHTESTVSMTTAEYTNNGYMLTLTGINKVYEANDKTGNSALKLGTKSKTGSFSFTVADDVTSVEIKVAGYKAATSTKIKINGTEYKVATSSDNGEYTTIKIDTTTTKTVEFVTVTYRAMIDSISFIA